QQHILALTDISHISSSFNKERCNCDIILNGGFVININGTHEEVEYLYSNLYARWIDFKKKSDNLSAFETNVKFGGIILLLFILVFAISNRSGPDSQAMSNVPTATPSVAYPVKQIEDSDESLLISKITQQARPNAELSALLKMGAATNDYSVRLGESDQTKPVFYVFSDPLCPHCRKIESVLEKLADDYVIDIFPVSKYGRERSKPIVETVLCSKPEDRDSLWKEVITGHSVIGNPCTNGNIALTNNNATYSRYSFIGTPTVIRGDGAVFPLTTKILNEENLKSWLKGDF
ncbi:thioredoxin fold domain-containing protein, partial [Salmonella enterica]|nr:thioredoxin fold domain-containing protein [Salmonella enterica]